MAKEKSEQKRKTSLPPKGQSKRKSDADNGVAKPPNNNNREPLPFDNGNGDGGDRNSQRRARFRRLIEACLLSPDHAVSYEDVENQYAQLNLPNPKETFSRDCEDLIPQYRTSTTCFLEPFALPLPEFSYNDRQGRLTLIVGARPFASSLINAAERHNSRREICRFLIGKHWPQQKESDRVPILPNGSSRVFVGFGTTMYWFVRELLNSSAYSTGKLTVFTSSLEVASLLYYRHEKAVATSGIRLGGSLVIDRGEGAVHVHNPNEQVHVNSAFISCSGLGRRGQFYSNAPESLHQITEQFLKNAERIVILAERTKMGQPADGFLMNIPSIGKTPILLVSNATRAEVEPYLLPEIQFLQATSPPPSPPDGDDSGLMMGL
jgi:hypothetical protein